MRFKSRIGRESLPKLALFVKQLCEPGAKSAVILFGAETCRATVTTDDDKLLLYASLTTNRVFEAFNIESKNDNIIGLEIGLNNLNNALKTGPSAQGVLLKLTKKGPTPYLCVEINTVEGGLSIVQDVPVRVLLASEFERYNEPRILPPAARLVIPFTKTVFSVVDRVKSLGAKTLTLTADAKLEELTVSASTDTVSIKTYFRGLACGADNEEGDRSNAEPVSLVVNTRDLAKVLKANSILTSSSVMCLCPGTVVIVHAAMPDSADPTFDEGFGSLLFMLATVGEHSDV